MSFVRVSAKWLIPACEARVAHYLGLTAANKDAYLTNLATELNRSWSRWFRKADHTVESAESWADSRTPYKWNLNFIRMFYDDELRRLNKLIVLAQSSEDGYVSLSVEDAALAQLNHFKEAHESTAEAAH